MTTAGRTASGGTGKTVKIIQSGLANFGSIPKNKSKSLNVYLYRIGVVESPLCRCEFANEGLDHVI